MSLSVNIQFRHAPAGSVIGKTDCDRFGALRERHCNFKQRLAEVTCAGVHALQPLTVAATPTSVDGHTWRFKEGVCGCSKLLPHIYTHLTWHALSLSPLIINTFQDLCVIMCSSKFYSVPCPGVEGGLLPATSPQLALVHFPVVWVQDRHELIYAGHRPQLLLQVFAFESLDLAPVGLRFREAQSRLEGGDGGGRLARTRDQRSGEQGTRQRQEAQQVHGGWTGSGEAGPLAGAGWGARLRSSSSSQSRGFLPGTPLGERLPGLSGSQLLPSAMAARAGERLPGVRYEPHRKPDIRTALGGGRRGEARAPGAGSVDRGFVFGVFAKKGGWGEGGEAQSPRDVPLVPRSPRVPRPPPPSPRPK